MDYQDRQCDGDVSRRSRQRMERRSNHSSETCARLQIHHSNRQTSSGDEKSNGRVELGEHSGREEQRTLRQHRKKVALVSPEFSEIQSESLLQSHLRATVFLRHRRDGSSMDGPRGRNCELIKTSMKQFFSSNKDDVRSFLHN